MRNGNQTRKQANEERKSDEETGELRTEVGRGKKRMKNRDRMRKPANEEPKCEQATVELEAKSHE
jgi:hypothetical protein